MIPQMRWISLISSEHAIQMQKNTYSSQLHMEQSPGQTTSWVTNQTSVKLKIEIVSGIFSNQNTMRLDINYKKKKTVRNTNTWRLNNTFLNNQQVTEEIKREINNFLETNDNENTTQNLQEAAKAFLRGKFIVIQYYLRKQEKHQIDNLTLYLKQLENNNNNNKILQNQQKERNLKDLRRSKRKRNE